MHPDYRVILAANRDEFHQRPSREIHWWPDRPDVLAGRDLQAGGTWLAASRSGRFATVTNYRERQRKKAGLTSRGEIVTEFVAGKENAEAMVGSLDGGNYAGFSLLAGDADDLWYVSNRGDGPDRLEPGVYGLSNASLDTPWSKLVRSRKALRSMVDSDSANETNLFRLLADRTPAPISDVEEGDLPFEVARAITAPFIVSPDYGTRCTTVLTLSNDGVVTVVERRFDASGEKTGESRYSFDTAQG